MNTIIFNQKILIDDIEDETDVNMEAPPPVEAPTPDQTKKPEPIAIEELMKKRQEEEKANLKVTFQFITLIHIPLFSFIIQSLYHSFINSFMLICVIT